MELTLKTVLNSDAYNVRYNRFYNIDDKYFLGDSGILIDRTGQLLWHEKWQHSILSTIIYLGSSHILITDRHAMPGPRTMNLGICGIDMNNGKYLWKHWYEDSWEERMSLRQGIEKVKKDICLISFKGGYIAGDYLLANYFKIQIKTGEYEFLEEGDIKQRAAITEKPIIPRDVIHDTVNYRGSIKNFALPGESSKKWGDKFSWFERVMSTAREQKILPEIKIYDIVEFFDNNLLITGKDMKQKKDSIWLLSVS